MKGTRFRGQIRSESPDTTGPILAAVHPKPPLRHTHRSVDPGQPSALFTDVRPVGYSGQTDRSSPAGASAALLSPLLSRPLPYQVDSGLQSMPRDDSE
jgi:hypothetical protein